MARAKPTFMERISGHLERPKVGGLVSTVTEQLPSAVQGMSEDPHGLLQRHEGGIPLSQACSVRSSGEVVVDHVCRSSLNEPCQHVDVIQGEEAQVDGGPQGGVEEVNPGAFTFSPVYHFTDLCSRRRTRVTNADPTRGELLFLVYPSAIASTKYWPGARDQGITAPSASVRVNRSKNSISDLPLLFRNRFCSRL